MCLRDKQLETAASFLIVLQSMEPTVQSKDVGVFALFCKLFRKNKFEDDDEILYYLFRLNF